VRFNGAGDGNRTRTSSLEGYSSTIELLPLGDIAIHQNFKQKNRKTVGGGRWIRTTEGMSQQIYSLPPLAAWVSLQKFVVPSRNSEMAHAMPSGRWIYSSHPETRPFGRTASQYVQIRSRRICRTTAGMSRQICSLPSFGRLVSLRIQFRLFAERLKKAERTELQSASVGSLGIASHRAGYCPFPGPFLSRRHG
jgi:hypothetical protein